MSENPNPDNGGTGRDDSTQEEQSPYADLDRLNSEPEWKSDDRDYSQREQEQESTDDK